MGKPESKVHEPYGRSVIFGYRFGQWRVGIVGFLCEGISGDGLHGTESFFPYPGRRSQEKTLIKAWHTWVSYYLTNTTVLWHDWIETERERSVEGWWPSAGYSWFVSLALCFSFQLSLLPIEPERDYFSVLYKPCALAEVYCHAHALHLEALLICVSLLERLPLLVVCGSCLRSKWSFPWSLSDLCMIVAPTGNIRVWREVEENVGIDPPTKKGNDTAPLSFVTQFVAVLKPCRHSICDRNICIPSLTVAKECL